ncbi:hypothetical protein ELG83_24770 (plasmid) [Rhizobium leguminosarum]|uniref:Uncharacterized protein n=1 Tax=Rhizobium leguminosarum bv. viciae TaxID=387 RepID=A0A8I2H3D3_RHILV|nr:hypothetical protein [Rhizobium leguminosarum]NKM48788.1 hypothetical protein [Rhizobium leguminosarum bv. viciae]TBF88049.1 hypothetical protein ELG83_24770 [Rhizobium leguminosarum]
MAYSKADFRTLTQQLHQSLIAQNGEPLSCELYATPFSHGSITVEYDNGDQDHHVAEACNIAAVISSIGRILSLPRSNIACEEMSEVLLLRLDVLREYIRAAIETAHKGTYSETDADRMVRRWAGFLKHPSEYVFAHRCLSSTGTTFDPPAIEINCAFLASWDKLKLYERDQKKSDLAHQIVSVNFPSIAKIDAFFKATANHINKLIAANFGIVQNA